MTREQVGPTTGDESWETRLTRAFEIILGRPLASYDPDGVYAVYFGGNFIDEIEFSADPAWVRPAALSGAEPVVWDYPPYDMGEPPMEFDASRSLFEIHKFDLPDAFEADLAEACFSSRLIRGADLAPLLARHGIDLADPALADAWSLYQPRVVSDGTLLGALRAATGLSGGPDSLLPFEAEASEEWAEALAEITPPELVTHLSFFCTDGEEGLMYLGTDRTGGPLLEEEGCTLIANWEEGQSQIEFAVVQLSPLIIGPNPR